MQENEYMDGSNFSTWMTFFIRYHERRGNLGPTRRMLLILDGHKSHFNLEVLLKAKTHGIDMVSLPSHTSHELQPLDIFCFKPLKQAFRAYRDIWSKSNIGNEARQQNLAQWKCLTILKALIPKNIIVGFRAAGIYPLNKDAMMGKMGAHEIFHDNERRGEDSKKDLPSVGCEQKGDLQIDEILEEGIPSPLRHYPHYYVSKEDESPIPPTDCNIVEVNLSQPSSQFMRLPHIQVPMASKVRSEPIIDYSHSQILTSTNHVDKLRKISEKKAMVEEEKAAKQKERELTKRRRAEEKFFKAAAKRRRAEELEARKVAKQKWTTIAIRAAGE